MQSWRGHFCGRRPRSSSQLIMPAQVSSYALGSLIASRPAISFMTNRITKLVEKSLNRLTNRAFQDEKLVTESLRKLEKMPSTNKTLAERLQHQRHVARYRLPTAIVVDKSKQYINLTWPGESSAFASHAPASQLSDSTTRSSSDAPPNSAVRVQRGSPCRTDEYRTRALAEYLRVYTPSTDGSYANNTILIYGRRGIFIKDVFPIGNYGLRIVFSDGHTGGIFSYEYLHFLTCPEHKYGLMRDYIKRLRQKGKSREPPHRKPSRREYGKVKPIVVTVQ